MIKKNTYSTRQFHILLGLYKASVQRTKTKESFYQLISEAIASGLGISKSSAWLFEEDKLVCKYHYNDLKDTFETYDDIIQEKIPLFFEYTKNAEEALILNKASNKEIFNELSYVFCEIFNWEEIICFPFRINQKVIGVLFCFDVKTRNFGVNEISFGNSVANILGQIFKVYNKEEIEKVLKENQERFKFISENITDGIYIVDNHIMIFASSIYLKMLGFELEDKIHIHVYQMFEILHPEDVERVFETVYSAIINKQDSVKYVFRCLNKNGEFIWREDKTSFQYDKFGNEVRAITITRDVTLEKENELKIAEKREITDLHNQLLIKLYSNSLELEIEEKIKLIIYIAAQGLDLERVGYWGFKKDNLICYKLYTKSENKYEEGQKLNIVNFPKYIQAINNLTSIVVKDVNTNVIVEELLELYYKPNGIKSTLNIPIRENGKLQGILCCESTRGKFNGSENYISFAKHLADFLSLSLEEHKRKSLENKLIKNQERLEFISKNTSDGFVIFENDIITYVSPAFINLSGYSEKELIGLTISKVFSFLHPKDIDRIKSIAYGNINKKMERFTYDYRVLMPNGNYSWREDSVNAIYNEDSKFVKLIVISRDINERKKAHNRLIESEQQLRLITENTSDGVMVIENGKLSYISPSYARLLDYTERDYKEFTLEKIFEKFHSTDVMTIKPLIENKIRNNEKELKYEHRLRLSNGKYQWREDSANIIYDENGKFSKYIVVTRDITDRKEAEKEKARLYEITESQNEKLIKFTHIVSHDIRSHTSNFSMILDLYEDSEDELEKREYFNMLKQSNNKLSETILYLNETVAIQSGKPRKITKLYLKEEIEKAILGMNAIILTNNAKINIQITNDLEIEGTQSYLESIIFNMLTNAIKYKSPKRKPIINISAKRVDKYIKLSFKDNGIGIDLVKNKDKIFGMYKTFNSNPDAVGLGLFMSKTHIESMGGKIEVESSLGKGSTFNLYFI